MQELTGSIINILFFNSYCHAAASQFVHKMDEFQHLSRLTFMTMTCISPSFIFVCFFDLRFLLSFPSYFDLFYIFIVGKNVKQSHYRPVQAQRVLGI